MSTKKLDFSAIVVITATIMIVFGSFPAFSQTANQAESIKKLTRLVGEIDDVLVTSGQQIEIGEYKQAKQLIEKSLEKIQLLADIFMPLPDRIKKLIKQEKTILKNTRQLAKRAKKEKRLDQEQKQKLTHDQVKNRDDTINTIRLLESYLQSNPDQNQTPDKVKSTPQNQQKEVLKEILPLLNSAAGSQDQAVAYLNRSDIEEAIPSEKKSIKDLENALLKLSQNQKKNQQKQSGKSKQDQPDKSSQNQSDTSQKNKKSLTPKEALVELEKQRKRATDEKKRREKAYGKIAIPQKAPVEKDW